MITPQVNSETSLSTATFRPGTVADSYDIFIVFEKALADLLKRFGSTTPTSIDNPAALARMWEQRRSLYEHMARTAARFWIAERDGQIIGFARVIVRDGHQQLTELFVLPNQQSGGVGRGLTTRVFQTEGVTSRSIIATTDIRAQALYLKMGVFPRFPIYYFGRQPRSVSLSTDLVIKPIIAVPKTLETLAALDKEIINYRRDVDHTWLASDRQGYLYYRKNQAVGYGYVGVTSGPFVLQDSADFPAVLAHAENQAAAQGYDEFGVEVPIVNQTAVNYLSKQGFKLDTFVAVFMSDAPAGKFENYILTSPPFAL